jgi:hypothetical protein
MARFEKWLLIGYTLVTKAFALNDQGAIPCPKSKRQKKTKIKRKLTAKKSKPQKSKAKKHVDAFTSVVSDDALERAAGRSITYECD